MLAAAMLTVALTAAAEAATVTGVVRKLEPLGQVDQAAALPVSEGVTIKGPVKQARAVSSGTAWRRSMASFTGCLLTAALAGGKR
jgi:hypothetical protein